MLLRDSAVEDGDGGVQLAGQSDPQFPDQQSGGDPPDGDPPDGGSSGRPRLAKVIPLKVFDPFEEARKRW